MNDPIYILDASVFIEAHRRYYAFDIAPKFWEILLQHANGGRVKSIDRIKEELARGKDELNGWAEKKLGNSFVSTDDMHVIQKYSRFMQWVNSQDQYKDEAKEEFAQVADGWLVAYASAKGAVVITQEIYDSQIRKKVPIPNVCHAFGISYKNTFDMMRSLGIQ